MKMIILLAGLVSFSAFAVDVQTLIADIELNQNVKCDKIAENKLGIQINLVRYHKEVWGCIGAQNSYKLNLKVKRSTTFTNQGKTTIEEVTNVKFN